MLVQNATIEAALIGAVSLVVGSMLGGLVATFFLHIVTSKAEKRKVIRQKIEELYVLINEMEFFSTTRAIERATLPSNEYINKYIFPNNKYLVEEDTIVAKMKMIVSLYIPKLAKQIDEYKQEINRANRRIENELDPKGKSIANLSKDNTYLEAVRNVGDDIRNVCDSLRTVLIKVIPKR